MAAYQVSPLDQFDFSRPNDWPKWVRRFERFQSASGLTDKVEIVQVHTLIYSMGDAAGNVLKSFNLTEEEQKTYTTVKEKFDNHFVKKRNVIYERAHFNQRCQEEGETFDDFVTALYGLVEHCKYENLRTEMIRDRIVVGLRDQKLSERLQLEADLTLEKAMTMARQSESVRKQQSVIRGGKEIAMESSINVVNRQKGLVRGAKGRNLKLHPINSFVLGVVSHPHMILKTVRLEILPAISVHDEGTSRDCRSADRVREIYQENSSDSSDDTTETFIGIVVSYQESPNWTVNIMVNDHPVEFSIDTGADVTVISEHIYQQAAGKIILQPTNHKLCGPSRYALSVMGKCVAKLKRGNREIKETVYVVRSLHRSLLGRPAIESLQGRSNRWGR